MMRKILIKQNKIEDCGPTCLAMVAKYYYYKVSVEEIRYLSGTENYGTSAYGLKTAAEKIGFKCKVVSGNEQSLTKQIPLPCIAHVIVNGNLLHYIVIYKISQKHLIIADPAKGILKIKINDFMGANKNNQNYRWTGILIWFSPNRYASKIVLLKENNIYKIFKTILKQKKYIFTILISTILLSVIGVISTLYYKILLDIIIPNKLVDKLLLYCIGISGVYLLLTIFSFLKNHLLLLLTQKLNKDILYESFEHIVHLPVQFFAHRDTGDIISRFNDASTVMQLVTKFFLTIIMDIIMVFIGAYLLFSINKQMFLISTIIVLIYFIIVLCFNKPLRILNKKNMEAQSNLSSHIVQSIHGIITVKTLNAEDKISATMNLKLTDLIKNSYKLNILSNIQINLVTFSNLLGGLVILWLGASNIISSTLSIGELITFTSLVTYFMSPLIELINLQPQMQTALVASERISDVIEYPAEKYSSSKNNASLNGDIKFTNLTFRYGLRDPIFKNISFTIKKGTKVGLSGNSGLGKTTLVKLILKFYNVEEGSIIINNLDIETLSVNSIREKITYIPQDTYLFSGTLWDNITFGINIINNEDVKYLCEKLLINEFANKLPSRYETIIGENGYNLSGGQKQRLAIVRAILKNPDILILDEATSNLDSDTENSIIDTINDMFTNNTVIYISHKVEVLNKCDIIYSINDGNIIEQANMYSKAINI